LQVTLEELQQKYGKEITEESNKPQHEDGAPADEKSVPEGSAVGGDNESQQGGAKHARSLQGTVGGVFLAV
jgi:hypothetical protein